MSVLKYLLRAESRRRAPAWIGLAVLMALASGVALAAAAGARRTASSYPRLLRSVSEQDAEVELPAPDGTTFNDRHNPRLDAVDRLPQVVASGRLYQLLAYDGDRLTAASTEQDLNAVADGYGTRVERPVLQSGRLPDPSRIGEALVDPRFAADNHLHVGSHFSVVTLDSDKFDQVNDAVPDYHGPTQVNVLTVTGIGQSARDINPTTVLEDQPHVYVSQAFVDARAASLSNVATAVRLRPGTDVGTFQAAVNQYARAQHIDPHAVYFTAERDHTLAAERAVRPQALALALFALVVALVAIVVVGQSLSRQVFIDGTDSPLLGAMGLTRRQRFGLAFSRVVLVTVLGAVGAVGVAIALSPLFPFGPARATEPSPGLAIDASALALGFVVVCAVFLVRGAVPAWRQANTGLSSLTGPAGRDRPSALARALARSGAAPTSVVGVRMAFEPGRGRTAVPVRGALVTITLAVVAVVAVTTFAANLDHLVRTPSSYGWSWTASTGFGFEPAPAAATKRLVADPALSAVGGGNYLDLHLGAQDVPAVTLDVLKGNLAPEMLAGHAPQGEHDLVLGTQTMRAARVHLGQQVKVELNGAPDTMRIVGRAVFPRLGAGIFTPTDLGQGAMLTDAAATKAGVDSADPSDPHSRYSVYLLQAAPGASLTAVQAQLNRELAGTVPLCPGRFCVVGPQPPGDVVAYGRVHTTGVILIALLALIAAAALVHALVTSTRRRQRDVAVLKMLGFVRRQVAAMACWQGLALTAVALLIGVPVGLILGRWSWFAFADQVGVARTATIPWFATLAVIPLALAVAVLASVLPAVIARRTRPVAFLQPA